MNKPQFTVCLIAKNEEKTLPHLLESLKEFQERRGEVLLLDTNSTDNTVQVAKDLGCKVFEVKNKFLFTLDTRTAEAINRKFVVSPEPQIVKAGDKVFDYASARNYIASLSETNMIAMPDCDEVYTKLDIDTLDQHIISGKEQFEYNFVFSHDDEGKPVIQFIHSKFYNRKKLEWRGIIHECLFSLNKRNPEINRQYLDESTIKLEHWQNEKTNRNHYLTGLALDCFKDADNDRNAHYFGRELMYKNHFLSAIAQLKRHIEMNRWPTEMAQSMIFIGDCYSYLGNTGEMIASYAKAFDMEPNRREPFMKLAEYYYRKNCPFQAMIYTEAALKIRGTSYYANFQPYYEYIPHEILYWAYYWLGDTEKSKEHLEMALQYQPNNQKYWDDLQFFYKLPRVSFVIPTIRKTGGLEKCLASIENLKYPKELIDIKVVHGEGTVPVKVKNGVEQTSGEYIVFGADDMEFEPNSLYLAVMESLRLNKGLVSFNEGPLLPDEGNICTHFLIKRSLVETIGEIFDTELFHIGCDNLLWAKCMKLNEAYHSESAKIQHHHFSKGFPTDEFYIKGWSQAESDRALLTQKLALI